MAPSIARLLKKSGFTYEIGAIRNLSIETFVIEQMIGSLNAVLKMEQQREKIPLLLGHVPNWQQQVQVVMFSGGVAQCIFPRSEANCEVG